MAEAMTNELINAIAEKSAAEIERVLAAANAYRDEKLATAAANADEEAARIAKAAKAKAEDIAVKRATAARMERGKMLLSAKRRAISAVYDGLREEMKGLGKSDVLALIDATVSRYGESGQTVILSRDLPVTEKEVAELAAVKSAKIKAATSETLSEGFVLSGENFDLDFTYDAIAAGMRERTEKEVADKLFGEDK